VGQVPRIAATIDEPPGRWLRMGLHRRAIMADDLIVKGGRVLDPASGVDDMLDVAVQGDKIVAVGRDLGGRGTARTIDASGLLVTPGLIDLHTHCYWGAGYFGIDPDSVAWRSGVSTWVDAGSTGAFNFPAFREHVMSRSGCRILALLNISYLGLVGLNYDEYCGPRACDLGLLIATVERHRDVIVGIKTRMGMEGVCPPDLGPLRAALEGGRALDLPVMCHISGTPPPVHEILALLRPGDLVTHSYTGAGERLVNETGGLLDAAREARDRGVLFDVGHGAGSFSFDSAEALARAGFWPDTISSDLHQLSLAGHNLVDHESGVETIIADVRGDGTPAYSLLTVMTKFLYLGMPLMEVLRATTATPAAVLTQRGRIGTLAPGAIADIALLSIVEGSTELFDIYGNRRQADQTFRCENLLVGGRELPHTDVPPPPPWIRMVDRSESASSI
jgi:dihydroorotase